MVLWLRRIRLLPGLRPTTRLWTATSPPPCPIRVSCLPNDEVQARPVTHFRAGTQSAPTPDWSVRRPVRRRARQPTGIMAMKVLVTGGTGVVGLAAVAELVRLGQTVRVLSRNAEEDAQQ